MPRALRIRFASGEDAAAASAAPRARRKRRSLERPVQRGAIRLLAMAGFQSFHIPNGAALSGDKLARAKQMAVLKADGLRPGFPDLGVVGRFPRIGFMECKEPGGGTMSEDQEWWRDHLQAQGWPWFLVCSPEDALVALRVWEWRT